MAAINFPDSPTLDQEFSAGGRTWKWNGTVWVTVASTTIAPTPHATSHQDGGSDELLLAQVQVDGLATSLAGKAATVHTHVKADITDFAHTHNAGQIITTVNGKSGYYTITANDRNEYIYLDATVPQQFTIANVLAVGESVNFIQYGTAPITFVAGPGVTLLSNGGKLKSNGQYTGSTVVCVASGVYVLIGNLAA